MLGDESTSFGEGYFKTSTSHRLRVSLSDASGLVFAYWEFSTNADNYPGRFFFDPASLDQGTVIIEQAGVPPLAENWAVLQAPNPTSRLSVLVSDQTGRLLGQHRLRWPSPAEKRRLLRAWEAMSIAPARWFYVELTTHCNLACPFCPSKNLQRPRRHMSLDMAQRVFEEVSRYLYGQDLTKGYVKTLPMVFLHVMGEPILHPKLPDCIAIARNVGLAPAVFCNATLLNKKNTARLLRNPPDHLTLSLNVISNEGYRTLGTKDDLCNQNSRVVELLTERQNQGVTGMHVDLQYMTSKGRLVEGIGLIETEQQAWDLYRAWLSRVRAIKRDRRLDAMSPADPDLVRDVLAERTDPSSRLPLGNGISLSIKSGCSFGNTMLPEGYEVQPAQYGSCPFMSPFQQLSIYVDGSVSFCNLDHENTVNLGNLLDSSIDEIWTGPRLRGIRQAMLNQELSEPLCQRCLGTVQPVFVNNGPNR
ncbi:MAG: SPASM domain-containing protein [Candidatus Thiodiazotropha endolucinida]